MTVSSASPHRSIEPDRGSFRSVLRAEWTKFRTVPGWVSGMVVAALLIVFFAVLTGVSATNPGHGARLPVPVGPDGGPVTDTFYFVHQPLSGNGSISVSVTSLHEPNRFDGIAPWAKAGLIIKENTRQGSVYAAIMITSTHGVRMQYDFIHDKAGLPGPVSTVSPRWLRLSRSGDVIAGYDSADGHRWVEVGTVHLTGLSATVPVGMFVASPPFVRGGGTAPSVATAVFAHLELRGMRTIGGWTGNQVGGDSPSFSGYPPSWSGGYTESGGKFTVTGAGDIAPAVRDALPAGGVIGDLLFGTLVALIAVIVVAVQFITDEYRRGLIRTTLTVSPQRRQLLAAKAAVLGSVTFVLGLAGTIVAIPLGEKIARGNGVYLFPVAWSTEVRVTVGTAALLSVAAILALAVGAALRSSSGAITVVTLLMVLPYLLVITPFMPGTVSNWLMRVTPAAAFATQQTLTVYPQVSSIYTPANGYYPLAPWAGLAVLAAYAAFALTVATVLVSRRDV